MDFQCDSNFQVHSEIMGSDGFHEIGLKMQISFSNSGSNLLPETPKTTLRRALRHSTGQFHPNSLKCILLKTASVIRSCANV